MRYIEAPSGDEWNGKSLFVGGGITGTPEWQKEFVQMLRHESITILNPRRNRFDIKDPSAGVAQIEWEHSHMQKATAISFWFPPQTLCPITLYELGTWSAAGKKIFVGIDPDYQKRKDIEVQTRLARPDVKIVYDLSALAMQVRGWARR